VGFEERNHLELKVSVGGGEIGLNRLFDLNE
jgi:hypothetical protein